MTEQPVQTRANLLSQMAPHPSVTTDVLAGEERQFEESRLSGPPPIEHLEDSEAPAYVLTNEKRGVGLGNKRRTTSPDSGRGTVVLVTGRRILCLIGREPDDESIAIPHTSIASASFHTGLFAHRLEVRTPRKVYHCWVDRSASESLLADVTEFVRDRLLADPEELRRDDGASKVNWRGGAVSGDDG